MVNNGLWSAVCLLYTDSMLNGKIAFIRERLPKKPYLYGFEKSLQLLNLIFVYMNLLPVFFSVIFSSQTENIEFMAINFAASM